MAYLEPPAFILCLKGVGLGMLLLLKSLVSAARPTELRIALSIDHPVEAPPATVHSHQTCELTVGYL